MKLTDREWKAFHIGELFDYKRDQRQVAKNRLFRDVPYYSASDSNNGLTDMISNPSFVETDSSIICSTFGDAFFVHGRFTASDEMTILRNKYLNEYNGLLIAKMITQQKEKYSFGHRAFSKVLIRDYIMLPVNDDGEPDYDFMEQYIKERMLKKYAQYLRFLNRK